ncbi:MAG: sulfotransferase domain-containing protein [Methylococcaceae bacterium]
MNIFGLYKKFAAYRLNQKTTARNPQHNDFYIVEFPKSGITWLSTILANMALISSGRKEVAAFTAAHFFVPDIHVTRNLGPMVYNIPPVRMIKSHSEFNPNYAFVVYLARHPVDVMKSYYRFNMENGSPEFLSFDDFCRSDKLGVQAWKQHVYSWFDGKVIAQRVHLCRYEDLVKDTVGEIELISRNFGWNIDSGVIKLAIERSTVEVMKESERVYRSRNPRYTMSFIRGESDFEVKAETVSYIKKECKEELKLLGYE